MPKALVVVGPWGDLFRWREACHAQGVLYDDGYRLQNGYHNPAVRIVGMPEAFEPLLEYSVVVLVNIDAPALGSQRLDALQRFVQNGGGLVVLGGSWAYSRGQYGGTALETMLPVTFPPQHRLPEFAAGEPIVAAANSKWELKVPLDEKARAFYVQQLQPKPNATVELLAGKQPVFVTGEFEKGRVVACGLTVHGKAESDSSLAFWDWSEWPKVLGHAVDWASRNRPLQPASQTESKLRPLTNEELQQLSLEFQPVTDELVGRFVLFPTAPAASVIFDRWHAGKDFKAKMTPAAIDALARLATADWLEPLKKLADGGNPDSLQRAASLELLGATKNAAASKTLLGALADADVAPAAIDGLRRLGDSANVPALRAILNRSIELSDFRNPDHQNASGPVATRNGVLAVRSAIALYGLGEPEAVERMVSLYREIRFLRRVHANAAKRRVAWTDMQGQAILKAISDRHDDLLQLETRLLSFAGPIPVSQRARFTAIAVSATDEADVRWLSNGLLKSKSMEYDWSGLADAQDGIIRRAAKSISQ